MDASVKAFIHDLCAIFSAKDKAGWVGLFVEGPLAAHANDKTTGTKDIQAFNGGICAALCQRRIPMKIMAFKIFSDLAKLNFDRSEMEVLQLKEVSDSHVLAWCSAIRIDKGGVRFQELGVLYRLVMVSGKWRIAEIWSWDGPQTPPQELAEQMIFSSFRNVH